MGFLDSQIKGETIEPQVLREVMGHALPNGGYTKYINAFNQAMVDANINNVQRAAQWVAQLGHECVGLKHLEEIASGAAYEGRRDLGNTQPGDGVRYKGRGAIMVTGRSNYRNLSKWAHSKGMVPTPTYFEDNPAELQSEKYAFTGAVWYWTVARPQINALADAGDIVGVTRAINGGTNGLADRQARYARALAYGTRLLPGEGATSAPASSPAVYHPMRDETYTVSSGFGPRWGTNHNGLDFAAALGTPIYAPADGVVVQGSERAPGSVSGFGNWVWIDSQPTLGVDFILGHMQHHTILVRKGDKVKAGQMIARVGSEGGSTGPHLHFEIWRPPGRTGGKVIDPAPWLAANVNNNKHTATAGEGADEDMSADHIITFIKGFLGPVIQDVKDIRQQLTGGRDAIYDEDGKIDLAASYPGWATLGKRADGSNNTIVDAVGDTRRDIAALHQTVETLSDRVEVLERSKK